MYYKCFCLTEYYGLLQVVVWTGCYDILQMVLCDGILRSITSNCFGRDISIYYK